MSTQSENENKILLALNVDPCRCSLTHQTKVGDFYYYHFDDETQENGKLFDNMVTTAQIKLGIIINKEDYICEIAKTISKHQSLTQTYKRYSKL